MPTKICVTSTKASKSFSREFRKKQIKTFLCECPRFLPIEDSVTSAYIDIIKMTASLC